ncbi:hypothetical protein MBLNU459_g7437t1 [Dothideomycetes sp. NU459]
MLLDGPSSLPSSRNGASPRQTSDHANLDNFVALGLLSSNHSASRARSSQNKARSGVRSTPAHSVSSRNRDPSVASYETPASLRAKPSHNTRRRPSTRSSESQNFSHPAATERSGSNPPFDDELGSMINATGPRGRRERTFIGSACAACEEPLEHTLRGERILQLSCGHVSHEACFYEYIKEFEVQECPTCNAPLGLDTTRGGNINFGKLNNLVRTAHTPELRSNAPTPDLRERGGQTPDLRERSLRGTPSMQPTPWDTESVRTGKHSTHSQRHPDHDLRTSAQPSPVPSRERSHKYSVEPRHHGRNGSTATGGAHSSGDLAPESQTAPSRRHDYDVQSMETSIAGPRNNTKNPIPAPTVTVRSEFPTLSRSRQQQSLTCLVTVEVVDGKWRPDPEDIRTPPLAFTPRIGESPCIPQMRTPEVPRQLDFPRDPPEVIERVTADLRNKVDNWHGLDFARFGKLLLHGTVRVGKDRQSWQDLDCYLFTEMLICIKEKKAPVQQQWQSTPDSPRVRTKCTLKGSILIKRHLKQVQMAHDLDILTLSLSVAELPHFHLQFQDKSQMDTWRRALINIHQIQLPDSDDEAENSGSDEDDYATMASKGRRRMSSSAHSSTYGASKSNYTAPTDYTSSHPALGLHGLGIRIPTSMHVPLDIVIVIPISSSMQGLKISLLREVLRFMVDSLGDQDRMGLVTFGSSGGSMPLVGMTGKTWNGWSKVLESIRPVGQKSLRADVVDGANVAMDLLMQRKSSNPLSGILLISDSATSDAESVDFVVSRAEAAKIAIHSFGLGLTHKPDTMIELSTRTKATYTYVKDWMMLRECVAGCLGSMQSTSHQNVKLRLRLPEGSPAKFVKISGALHITKRATGRDAEASLGDLRFGDKRDILVQLAIMPDSATPEQLPQDPWETIVSGLEALGGPLDQDDMRTLSVEEIPLIQADLAWGDILREGNVSQLPRPSLLAITMLPSISKKSSQNSLTRSLSPPIPPHPSVVQRRMELLTSDMLTRALTLVSRGQHERACHLLTETRSILKGLGKGGLPPLPPPPSGSLPPTPSLNGEGRSANGYSPTVSTPEVRRTPSPPRPEPINTFTPAAGIDPATMKALDAELESSLEWINHPAVFGRDSRKAVLQAIGVISSQRGFTFRTPAESLWASRIPGVKRVCERSLEWREAGDEMLAEES